MVHNEILMRIIALLVNIILAKIYNSLDYDLNKSNIFYFEYYNLYFENIKTFKMNFKKLLVAAVCAFVINTQEEYQENYLTSEYDVE